jgi:RNA polymerase sigma-70 factor (ECF subfamily)
MTKNKPDSLKDLGLKFKETRSEKTYTELYHRIRPGLFNYVNGILQKSEESDHIVSQVMSIVYDKIDKYDPKWHISTWIYRIAYTHACMAIRYRKANKTTPMSHFENSENKNWISKIEFDSIENHTDHLVAREESDEHLAQLTKMRNIVESLPEEYKSVIEEKFFNDLQYDEISKKLNIPLHTVKNRVARGKRIIKEMYEKESE